MAQGFRRGWRLGSWPINRIWGDNMTSTQTPTWLTEQCPNWCVRDHREEDHPEDRFHQSEAAVVPVVAGDGGARDRPIVADSLNSTELTVRIGRHIGEAFTWLDMSPTEGRSPAMVLSRDSARSLARSILGLTGTN